MLPTLAIERPQALIDRAEPIQHNYGETSRLVGRIEATLGGQLSQRLREHHVGALIEDQPETPAFGLWGAPISKRSAL